MRIIHALKILISIIIIASLSTCSVKRVGIKEVINSSQCVAKLMYQHLDYDKFGYPIFSDKLNKKPNKQKNIYYVVCMDNSNRPLVSYQIAIKDPADKADGKNVLKVIYKWTGAGFSVGIDITKNAKVTPSSSLGWTLGQVILAYIIVPVVGGVSGFIIGVFASIPASIQELAKLGISGEEMLLGYTTYEYDPLHRLRQQTQYAPTEKPTVLTYTIYYYQKNADKPYKFTSYSKVEKKERIVLVKD